VFVWGYGILGKGPSVSHLSKPSLLPMPLFDRNESNPDVKVSDIYAGLSHFAAVTSMIINAFFIEMKM
jgi:RCC1-like G exchanging factor-like protein